MILHFICYKNNVLNVIVTKYNTLKKGLQLMKKITLLTTIFVMVTFQGCVTATAEIPPSYTSTIHPNIMVEHNTRTGATTYQTKYDLTNVLHLGYSEAKLYGVEKDHKIQPRLNLVERSVIYHLYNTINIANQSMRNRATEGFNIAVFSSDTSSILNDTQVFTIDVPLTKKECEEFKKILEKDEPVIITITDNGKNPSRNKLDDGQKNAMLEMLNFIEIENAKQHHN